MTAVIPIEKAKAAAGVRPQRIGVLLVNLGTPDSADARGVRVYLKEFLCDPRVIENQGLFWKLVLNGIILRIRPRRKARDYRRSGTPRRTNRRSRPSPARNRRSLPPTSRTMTMSWSIGRCATAIRRSVAHRRADGAGLRPAAGGAALSAIFGRDHGHRVRRSVPRARRDARAADLAGDAALLRRPGLYRGAGGLDRCASRNAAVSARADRGLVPRHAAEIYRQGRSLSGAMHRDDRSVAQAHGPRCLAS